MMALLRSSFRQFTRDRGALFMTLAFPIIFMLIFGMIYGKSGDFKADIGVAAGDNSPVAQSITAAFQSVPNFVITTGSESTMLAALKRGDVSAVVSIPAGVTESVAAGETAGLDVYYDPSNTTTAQIVMPIVSRVIDQVDRAASQSPSLLTVNQKSIQSHQMTNLDYLVPGIIAMSLLSTGLFCAIPLIQQREKKILKRWSATPLQRSSMIYSQVAFRLILALAQTGLLIVIASKMFGVQVLGNWGLLLGMVVLGSLCLISIGYLLASFIKTEESAMPVLQLVQFPMMFLSGIFFPLSMMPSFMKPVVNAMPLTYLGDALRQIMVQATPAHTLLLDAAVLGGILLVCLVLSVRYFRWE
jgi:ABC-2 type transport system permease protein